MDFLFRQSFVDSTEGDDSSDGSPPLWNTPDKITTLSHDITAEIVRGRKIAIDDDMYLVQYAGESWSVMIVKKMKLP